MRLMTPDNDYERELVHRRSLWYLYRYGKDILYRYHVDCILTAYREGW